MLGRPVENVRIPLHDGIVVELAGGRDLLLEIAVLLNCLGDGGVSLEVGVCLDLREEPAKATVNLVGYVIALGLRKTTATKCGDRLHHVLVEVDCLLDELREVLQYLDALFEVVVDGRGIGLNLLLELLEVVFCTNLLEEEN